MKSVPIPPSRAGKELIRSSMRDQGPVKCVLLKNGPPRLDPDNALSSRSRESNAEDNSGESPSNLLVEDVKVCDTCGNAGYEELLAVCNSCNEGAEHTYCMRIQMDSLPEGEWSCEMCQIYQREGSSKILERLLVPSKLLGRSTSINNRSKVVLNQGGSRSRLEDRLNHKKPRITPVRNSPSKAPILQTSVERSIDHYFVNHTSRKLATESTTWATLSTLPPPTSLVSTPLAKPLLTRENSLKSAPDTGRVKIWAPSAVANFSSGARATAFNPAFSASQSPKAAATGHAGNKSRLASSSNISESSTPLNKATSLNVCRPSPTTSPTPLLLKSSSKKLSPDFSTLTEASAGKLSAEFPSFLLNSSSRQGNVRKGYGESKSSRDGVSDGGAGHDLNAGNKDKAEHAFVVKSSELGRVLLESESVPDFPRMKTKPNTSICSEPWSGNSSSTWCFSCKAVGHSIQYCPHGYSLPSEQKVVNGLSNSQGTSLKPYKNSVQVFSNMDTIVPMVDLEPDLDVKTSLSTGLLRPVASVARGCSSDLESSKFVPSSSTPTDLFRKRSSNIKIRDSLAAGSKNPSLLNGTSLQQSVPGENLVGASRVANGHISLRPRLKVEFGPSCHLWTSSEAYDNEGPPGVFTTEIARADSTFTASESSTLLLVKSDRGSSPNSSYATRPKVSQEHPVQLIDAVFGPAPQVLKRLHPASGTRASWSEALSSHSVRGQGSGHDGYPCRVVQSFSPSSVVMYSQAPSMSYLTPQPPPFSIPYAPPAPPPVSSRASHSPATQVDAAVPSAAIAWRGALEVNDGQSTIVFDKILAHVSTKAVVKVYEVATSMPQYLRLEQVQRATDLETWPRQFDIRPPTVGSIALYFFASNGESFEKFGHNLVDKMMARDLVLRAHVDDAELLIYPSNKLSKKFERKILDHGTLYHDWHKFSNSFWRVDSRQYLKPCCLLEQTCTGWHGHMFLWGVFRARKQVGKTVSTSSIVVKDALVAVSPCFEATKVPPYLVASDSPVFDIMAESKLLNSSSSGCDNTGVVDMEVDMECGMSDKPFKRLDSANPPSTPLSPVGASMKAPTASTNLGFVPDCLLSSSDKVDNVQDIPTSTMGEDFDLPPGFAPALALRPKPVGLETLTPRLTLAPDVKKTEAPQQVDLGSSVSADEDPEQEGSELKGNMTSLDVVKNSNTSQVLPLSALNAVEHVESLLTSSCPPTTKPSCSNSFSPSRVKEREMDNVRDRVCNRVEDRERRDLDTKYERWDRSSERAREVHRDRDRDKDYEREKGRQRLIIRDRDRDTETYDRPKERARTRHKDRVTERERARVRNCETVRHRERERVRNWQRERLSDREKDGRSHWPRNDVQDFDNRIRYRRSRSCSRSQSPRRIIRSRSHGAGRRKARSRTPPPRPITRSPSLSRRYPSSYRQSSASGSDSPGSHSLEILQSSVIVGPRPWKLNCESVEGKRINISDKMGEDNSSRFSSRWKLARPVADTRSGSEGASNSKTVGILGHSNTMPISRSVTPVLDMNEGISEAFSAEGATSSASLPDLNTDSVESGVTFHDFLPADDFWPPREPDKASLRAEQAFFPGVARATIPHYFNTGLNFRNQKARHTFARERWGFAVSSIGSSRPNYTSRSSGYQFLHTPRLTDTISNSSPNLELALGGRETSLERTCPLPLFVDGHARSTSNLGFAFNAKIPDLRVNSSTNHQLGPPGIECGGTASLSLSLAVPQYLREGNSCVHVEGHGDVSNRHDVDFSLTL